jgi:KRAB domain-containing zinc finger protein
MRATIFLNDTIYHHVDGSDLTKANWMRFVSCTTDEHQNLEAFQYGIKIYYKTIKDIPANSELLVGCCKYITAPCKAACLPSQMVHMNFHAKQKLHKCNICDERFSCDIYLKLHTRMHKGKKCHQCTICGRLYLNKSNLNIHMRVHSGEKPFRCTECDIRCATLSTLKRHKKTHEGNNLLECEMCEKKCIKNSILKVHMESHLKKAGICNICHLQVPLNHCLKHMFIHTDEKAYQCNVCDKSFSRLGILKSHANSHYGNQLHRCTTSVQKFVQSCDLTSYIKTLTGDTPVDV